jgi:hypothetical protein
MPEYHILSLGAGVQSTTLYLMSLDGELDVKFDCAVFADTQEEPAAVYDHLRWMQSLGGPPIHVRTAGKLGDELASGRNSTGQRFASIPAFTAAQEGQPLGIVRRQCTSEYKIDVVEKYLRRELLGLQPKQRIPADVKIHQYMGFSFDEPGRAARTKARFNSIRWGEVHFPLFDAQMTRGNCQQYLSTRVPHEVPRSACVFCPFKSNSEWRRLRDEDPAGWARAVQIDDSLRVDGNIVNRNLNQKLYVHRNCRPLSEANLGDDQPSLFDMDCEGGCGL